MALPININELITGKTVEWERIEFKSGWNPLEVIQSVCAFANDINNWGGGYIILGIAEIDGKPGLPPLGIKENQVDKIQQELLELCHKLRPNYSPIAEPVVFQDKLIIIIWVPGGQARPYKAPNGFTSPYTYSSYVRRYSSTVKASDKEDRDLIVMSNNIPFDDQIRQRAEITDLKLAMIQSHLADIGSDLAGTADKTKFSELVRKMNIAEGPDEFLKPKNIGLLMFNNDPSSFFPCARIDLIEFKNDVGDKYTEKIFKGSIKQQLEDALVYIKNNIIAESVIKVPGKAEAIRYFNYPFEAIEEALVNTIYHRSYEDDSPIEFRVFPNRIEMISYPGPLPPLNKEKLKSGNIVARKYRNRRIGDFLKELHLTEGRGTGIPKIKRVMANNGSPEPIFETDDELSYFLTVLPVHSEWIKDKDRDIDRDKDGDKDGEGASESKKALNYCLRPKKRRELMAELGLHNNYDNFSRHVKTLLDSGYLEFTIPEKPSSGNQQYRTTSKGVTYLNKLNNL